MLLRINEQIVTEAEQNLLNTEEFAERNSSYVDFV